MAMGLDWNLASGIVNQSSNPLPSKRRTPPTGLTPNDAGTFSRFAHIADSKSRIHAFPIQPDRAENTGRNWVWI
jgi:hypothetical protein